jgi:hypothetical protein
MGKPLRLKNPVDPTYLDENINDSLVKSVGKAVCIQKVALVDTSSNPVADINDANPLTVNVAQIGGVVIQSASGVSANVISLVKNANFDTSGSFALRTPQVWNSALATAAGPTALWTPAGGKKFRLMGFSFAIPSIATSVAGVIINLLDAAAAVGYVAAIGATTTAFAGTVVFNGNGYLSAAINQVLNINLSAAITAGAVYVTAWGTEE